MADALTELVAAILSGKACSQEAGGGPYIYVYDRPKPFASRIARKAQREGLMDLCWSTKHSQWVWLLTEKGRIKFTTPEPTP